MSGLEKFQANDAWRTHFKKLLLTERKITPLPTEPIKQTQRFSLDIADDLFVILEEKKILQSKPSSTMENKVHFHAKVMEREHHKMFQSEDKENIATNTTQTQRQTLPTAKFTMADNGATTTRRYSAVSYCNETLLEEQDLPQWQRTSDESFETMEKMCDKTASDPNSTLFKYIHSDNKDKIVESAKKRSVADNKVPAIRGYDHEANALERLLDELRVEEQLQLENESPLKGVEVTQLEDIEAPSRLWDNTIAGESMLQTSPVKMVHLLRPSTIIEDLEDYNSDGSSQMSFQSVSTKSTSEVSSACYETAYDTTATSCADAANRFVNLDADLCSSVGSAVTNKFPDIALNSLPGINISNASEFLDIFSVEQPIKVTEEVTNLEEDIDLIDLEKTFAASTNSPITSERALQKTMEIDLTKEDKVTVESSAAEVERESSESEDSVIEILSDDEEDNAHEISVLKLKTTIKYEETKHSSSSTCSRSLLSEDINDDNENSIKLDTSDDKTLHFNDTMEEVEYMMKKGAQYLAATNSAVKLPESEKPKTPIVTNSSPFKTKQNTFLISPKADDRYRSPSPMLHKQVPFSITSNMKAKNGNSTPKSGEKPIAKPKPINSFSKEMKPFPKFDIFKKPTTSSIQASANMRHKDIAANHFSHIVSPIRTYIKNSTNTPLMHTINSVCKNPNSLNSMQELAIEGRLYKPNFVGDYGSGGGATAILKSASEPRNLPKKAYVSSEVKHIIDERTPVTIPGGKQYQKHIENAMLPAVLKHEGKMRMADVLGGGPGEASQSARRTDSSLADLSLMSGDVSMYTIKDAQKL